MLSENCRLLTFLLIWISFFAVQKLSAQQLTYMQGEIMISLYQESQLDPFLQANQRFDGKTSNLKLLKKLHTPIPIYRLSFDFSQIDERAFLNQIKKDPRINIAQFNHLVQRRTVPNDPLYNSQWHYFNNAFPMADIDAPLAWDTSTGGTTFDGDTIVVCIIDDGMEINHTDFGTNRWQNKAEIPNNGIDDDGNGYIDDYNGWNVHEQNDNLQTALDNGEHGTPIAGIIGAAGNNGIGVAGINWNVKLMTVVGHDNEAEVLEAYAYPYQLRKTFNESNGEEGALVVATNSSWGTAFGQASDAPLWCAFYDTLGQQGILSAGATINGNYNIDIVGDLPTSCASDYLISVTSLDHTGTKVNAAGYGANSIDLGAFGEEVFTTLVNNAYGDFSGTSAATPQIAGAIALLYASPCPSLASLAKIDPSFAAAIIKEYILTGSSPNASLAGISLTGGSLNLKNSINKVMSNCDFSDCAYPFGIEANNISDQSVELNWSVSNIVNNSNLRYRIKGTSTWQEISGTVSPKTITNLVACSTYEIQVQANCNAAASEYSESVLFKTKGCCAPPQDFSIVNTTQTTVHLNWEEQYNINSYEIAYRIKDSVNWTLSASTTPYTLLINLLPCTDYEVKVQGLCANSSNTGYTTTLEFTTLGCPNCQAFEYCSVEGNNDGNTWISSVHINQLSHSSGFEQGIYSDFTNQSTNLIQGDFHTMTIYTDYQFFEEPMYFRVWIDFNQDGDFEDPNEEILKTVNPSFNINSSIFIPSDAILGSTRMRVAARSKIIDLCQASDQSGEIEDYCVDIITATGCIPPYFLSCAHTETKSFFSWACNIPVDSFGLRYRKLGQQSWEYVTTQNFYYTINDLTPCTNYEYQVHSICGLVESVYSPKSLFKTKGCGACIDQNYCSLASLNANFEWIESITINDLTHVSGPNNGYANFSNFIFNFNTEVSNSFSLLPGFANQDEYEYFKIWIDLNQDGDFTDMNELIFDQLAATSNFPINGNFTLPSTAKEGSTKMRIAMKYNAAPNSPCEGDFSGEIEDYCINIYHQTSNSCTYPNQLKVNDKGMNFANLAWKSSNLDNVAYKLEFKADNTNYWSTIYTDQNNFYLKGLTECTAYNFRVASICSLGLSQMSNTSNFNTECTPTSSQEVKSKAFTVYPNPFSNYLEIDFHQNFSEVVQLKLSNAAGQQVYHQLIEASAKSVTIPIEQNLAQGIYFLQIQTEQEQFVQKIIHF